MGRLSFFDKRIMKYIDIVGDDGRTRNYIQVSSRVWWSHLRIVKPLLTFCFTALRTPI